ncbi:MAG: hypothetical protein QOD40_2146 [Alphaproteobacteria bacterium]|jgi:hypothetical protein|nr:hypothetical protein [Alphaproteobacteria bacterium]
MPRYFFNVEDGKRLLDDTGEDLPNLVAAQDAAMRTTLDLLKGSFKERVWNGKPWRIWVTDEPLGKGKTLLTLCFTAESG